MPSLGSKGVKELSEQQDLMFNSPINDDVTSRFKKSHKVTFPVNSLASF